MSTLTVTLAATSIPVSDGQAATTVSVTNNGSAGERVTVGVFPAAADAGPGSPPVAEWVSVERATRDIGAGMTEQFLVRATTPPTLPAGTHRIRLIAYSATQAPEENAGQARELEIVVPAAPAKPVPAKRIPWWVWAVAAGLVLAVVAVAVVLTREPSPTATPPTATSSSTSTTPALPSGACLAGFVERRARPADIVCVDPASALQAEFDNRADVQKARKNDPPGGPYGPDTCRVGWVWRDAFEGDHVCVTGSDRTRTAQENADRWLHTRLTKPTFIATLSTLITGFTLNVTPGG